MGHGGTFENPDDKVISVPLDPRAAALTREDLGKMVFERGEPPLPDGFPKRSVMSGGETGQVLPDGVRTVPIFEKQKGPVERRMKVPVQVNVVRGPAAHDLFGQGVT